MSMTQFQADAENNESRGQSLGPLFLVLEGIDGCGSTTQGEKLTSWLRAQKYRVYFTHEPSNGPAGLLIRLALARRLKGASGVYHESGSEQAAPPSDLDPYSLALLYAADRMDHLATEVIPNLRSNRIVICDRYFLSTLVYQGLSVDEKWLIEMNRFAPIPDLTIYLDVPVEHAGNRMRQTRWTRDLYEDEDVLRKIRDRYLKLVASQRPELGTIISIDASLSTSSVTARVRNAVGSILGKPGSSTAHRNPNLFEWPE